MGKYYFKKMSDEEFNEKFHKFSKRIDNIHTE